MFYFTNPGNEFIRGVSFLCYLPFIVSGFYLATLIFLTFLKSKYFDIRELVLVLAIAVAVTGATILELVSSLRFLVNGVGVASSLFYYIYFISEIYKKDPLTELRNRQVFYNDSNALKSRSCIVCIDMNNLKELNDEQGHLEGDRALILIAHTVNRLLNNGERGYRIGGDEFVIISKKRLDPKSVDELVDAINQKLDEYKIKVAIGYEFFEPGEDFNKIYVIADKKMYQRKKKIKK